MKRSIDVNILKARGVSAPTAKQGPRRYDPWDEAAMDAWLQEKATDPNAPPALKRMAQHALFTLANPPKVYSDEQQDDSWDDVYKAMGVGFGSPSSPPPVRKKPGFRIKFRPHPGGSCFED